MTLYITPFGRVARQRMLERMAREDEWPGMLDGQVSFPVDVEAETDEFIVRALLPGIKPEDLDIQIVNETVSIQGELKSERKENGSYLLMEIPSGRFSRVLSLPTPLDSAGAQASLDNGVLTLRIPKAETARPKQIKVQSR